MSHNRGRQCNFGSARMQDLLHSNHRLLDSDEALLVRKRSSCIEFLNGVDESIAQLACALDEMRDAKVLAFQDLDNYDRLLAPARKLPSDVLQEIFLHCVDLLEGPEIVPKTGSIPAFVADFIKKERHNINSTVIRVCREWRATALTCQALWSTLGLAIGSDLPPPGRTNMLLRQIQRAGSVPLSVVLWVSTNYTRNHPLLPIILSASCQMRNLVIHSNSGEFWDHISQIQGCLQGLESLVISSGRRLSRVMNVFMYAPELRFLRTQIGDLDMLELPWDQIKRYSNVHERPSVNAFPLFAFGTNLQHCTIGVSDTLEVPDTITSLDKLFHLTISSTSSPIAVTHLLNHIETPSLAHLIIRSSLSDPRCIANLARRSNYCRRLVMIALNPIQITPDVLLEILEALPALQHLQLACDKCFTDAVTDRLSCHRNGVPAHSGQSLSTMYLFGKLPCKSHSFAKMVESRWNHGSLFRRLRLDDGLGFSARDVKLLRKICSDSEMKFDNGDVAYHE